MNNNKIVSVPVTFNYGGKCIIHRTLVEYKAQVRALYRPMCTYGKWPNTQDMHN